MNSLENTQEFLECEKISSEEMEKALIIESHTNEHYTNLIPLLEKISYVCFHVGFQIQRINENHIELFPTDHLVCGDREMIPPTSIFIENFFSDPDNAIIYGSLRPDVTFDDVQHFITELLKESKKIEDSLITTIFYTII